MSPAERGLKCLNTLPSLALRDDPLAGSYTGWMDAPIVVAIFNTSPDTIDMLRLAFEHAGMIVVTGKTFDIRDGVLDVERFLEHHDPSVIVYDVAPPYEANWNLLSHLRSRPAVEGRRVIVTTTNAKYVTPLADGEPVHEIVGKPYDLGRLVESIRIAAGR